MAPFKNNEQWAQFKMNKQEDIKSILCSYVSFLNSSWKTLYEYV